MNISVFNSANKISDITSMIHAEDHKFRTLINEWLNYLHTIFYSSNHELCVIEVAGRVLGNVHFLYICIVQ